MNVEARKRVYWFYVLLAILFFFFYLLVIQSSPESVNYNYSDILMRKLLNAPRIMKVGLLYFFFVISTSFAGYVVSRIIKAIAYQKSFLISFIVSLIIGASLFTYFILN